MLPGHKEALVKGSKFCIGIGGIGKVPSEFDKPVAMNISDNTSHSTIYIVFVCTSISVDVVSGFRSLPF